MQKFITFCLLTMWGFNVYADSDYAATWRMSGIDFGTDAEDQLVLDLNEGTRFVTANGIVLDDLGDAFPATGTCYFTTGSFLICNLAVDFFSLDIAIDLTDGSGLVQLIDYDGLSLFDGSLTLTEVK
ncbi:MAG: hypothetical protein R3F41_13375 [Gammaproteobacteria bacterium]|nr:hypothetical protein [Pseudomonadales bacterium]MCP5349091.1 hypothetical protein [Pseudomonadales bacterium]